MYYNPYLIVPLATWIIVQTTKFCVAAIRGELDFKYLYASGGMPSVHSAVVCSLAITSLLVDGPDSHLFGFTVLFAAIVMYDSFGVRRSTGEQAVAINMIAASLVSDKIKLTVPYVRLREVLGHKPAEVTVGAALGIFLACLFNMSHLTAQIDWLSAVPVRLEMLIYAAGFAVLLIAGLATKLVLAQRYRGSAIIKQLGSQIFLATQTLGWLGLIAAFGQYQRLPYLLWRAWPFILILAALGWSWYLAIKYWVVLPPALSEEREAARKRKWFQKKPKKRRS